MISTRPTAPTALLVIGALLVPVEVALSVSTSADLVYQAVMTLAAVSAVLRLRSIPRTAQPAARLAALSLVLYAVGDGLWLVVDSAGGNPDGSVADVLYLAGYASIGAMLVVLLMPLRAGRWTLDVDVVIDALTVVSVSVLLLWELVIRGHRAAPGVSVLGQTDLVYPVVDAVLIALVLRVLTHSRARGSVALVLGIALTCWLVGDYGYLFATNDAALTIGTDVLWMVGALLFAYSTARLGALDADVPPPSSSNLARLSLAIGPLLVPPGLVVVETLLGRDPENMSLVIGIVVLIALAFARTERLLVAERRALRDLAAARDAAVEATRAKSTFLATISHEIRTPMNGVLGLSRLLSTTTLDEEQRRWVGGIEKAGGSLMSLLDDVLDFAMREDGRIHVDAIDFDVVEVVEDVASMVAEQAHHRGLELVAVCSPDLPRGLHGDPTRLRQVLLNFASNAVKFTTTGEVVISATLDAHTKTGVMVRFAVSDTGIGIAPEDREDLYEAFTQVQGVDHESYGGTGLGLAIARTLVTAMDGDTGLESEPGRGSTFWCRIPLRAAQHQQPIATRPSRALPGTRVLVVDDNASSRVALRDQFVSWGLHVDLVEGGAAALDLAHQADADGTPYRLVVSDQGMPGMDGLDLTRAVRACEAVAHTPVLLLTSGPVVPPGELHSAGVTASTSKPTQVSRLQGAVQRALGSTPDAPVLVSGTTPVTPGRGVVLVVEDSEVNQMVAVGTLRRLGYLTEVAVNGLEAVEMVGARNYDVVLMDCRMPVMDGYEAASEIRRRERAPHRVPIVAVTASGAPADRERCLAAGMDDYLVKPLGQHQLAETVARWVPRGADL